MASSSWGDIERTDFYGAQSPEGQDIIFNNYVEEQSERIDIGEGNDFIEDQVVGEEKAPVLYMKALNFIASVESIRHQTGQARLGRFVGDEDETWDEREKLKQELLTDHQRRANHVLRDFEDTRTLDRIFRTLRRNPGEDVEKEFTFNVHGGQGKKSRTLSKEELDWFYNSGLGDPINEFNWRWRYIDRPAHIPGTEEETMKGRLEINPALAVLGFKHYREAVEDSTAPRYEKIKALAAFNTVRSAAKMRYSEYIGTKRVTGVTPYKVDKTWGSDTDDPEIPYESVPIFMDEKRLRALDGNFSGKGVEPFVAEYWLRKQGLESIADEVISGEASPEVMESLRNLHADAIMRDGGYLFEAAWPDDKLFAVASNGEKVVNPKIIGASEDPATGD